MGQNVSCSNTVYVCVNTPPKSVFPVSVSLYTTLEPIHPASHVMLVLLLVAGSAVTDAAPQYYSYIDPTSYTFGYTVDAVDANQQPLQFGHNEGREGEVTTGKYYVLLSDSRVMTVDYYVDDTGFHPTYTFQGEAVYPSEYSAPQYGK
ncbi:uncharacterized protein [Panulirus ornatus]|uniref:uncharacterized protein n=1 Tax=Panulirus ornatus TaxID=150431 RepID=UPI003A8956E6